MLLAVIPALICGIPFAVDFAGRNAFGPRLTRLDSKDIPATPSRIIWILLTVDQAGRSTFGAWLVRFDSEDITSIPDSVGWIPAPIWKLAFRFLVSCVRAHV
jgi:hypothetical protein